MSRCAYILASLLVLGICNKAFADDNYTFDKKHTAIHFSVNRLLTAGLSAITAAVAGVVLNLAVWFALHTLFTHVSIANYYGITLNIPDIHSLDIATLLLAASAMLMIFRFKLGMMPTLVICALAGVGIKYTLCVL